MTGQFWSKFCSVRRMPEQLVGNQENCAVSSGPRSPGADRKAQISADIQRFRSACGCELASLFMIAATVLFLTYIAYGPGKWSAGEALWRGMVWVVSVSVVGKLLGLAYARVRLQMLRSALRRELQFSTTAKLSLPSGSFDVRHQMKGVDTPWP
jgi:hypothetical protein